MYPILFKIPLINLPVYAYGVMIVIGFLTAIFIVRRLSRDITPDPTYITNAALYSLVAGIAGARLFYVVHYFDRFKGQWLSVFAIWKGGLELLGGVVLAVAVIWFYIRRHKLPFRHYVDILAIGLMAALAFGRVGCFLRGDCYGKPSEVPWAVRFPYGSDAYLSQVRPDPARNRYQPYLKLPAHFFGYVGPDEEWQPAYGGSLKPFELLTEREKYHATKGLLRSLPVHPTQLYSSLNAAVLCAILFLVWRRARRFKRKRRTNKFLVKPGCTFALMFILYGITRFFIEFLRDDNPFEFDNLTISQNISILLVVLGAGLIVVFTKAGPGKRTAKRSK